MALPSDVAYCVVVAAPFFDFGTGRLPGIDVATKISKATTSAPAPMITNRFCWNCCLARSFVLVASSGPFPSASPAAGAPMSVSLAAGS